MAKEYVTFDPNVRTLEEVRTALQRIANLLNGLAPTVGAMTAKSPETDAEAGYLTINIGGTTYEIPFYAIA